MTGAYGLVPRWQNAVASLESVPCPLCGELITVEEIERREHIEACEHLMNVQAMPAMNRVEARLCVDAIHDHLRKARAQILELYEREGWKALGYASWRECVTAEFEQSQSQLYRQLAAAFVERVISPNGEIGTLPESHARPLVSLQADELLIVWQVIEETAPGGRVTETHVRSVVNVLKDILATGVIDDGTGTQIPIAQATLIHLKAAVTEETYERMKRQITHIADNQKRKTTLLDKFEFDSLSDADAGALRVRLEQLRTRHLEITIREVEVAE